MTNRTVRARLMASSMITGAAMAALSAGGVYAQAANPPAATDNGTTKVQEFVVTGSRIPQPNLTSVSPLSVVTSTEVKLQGTTNVETLLQNLPSVIPEFNQGVDNGATGTATVSLRGLGSKRTLVLVNGNRLMPGDPAVPSPDLNNIPAALVDRVEVITGGASAVYGSDAVAGVVNFVMKKDFEGVRVDAQYGFAFHNNGSTDQRRTVMNFNAGGPAQPIPLATNSIDGMTYNATVIVGANAPDGKGNVTAYVGYRNIQPIPQSHRDAGACGLSSTNTTTAVYDTQLCQGSSNSAFGKFVGLGPGGSNLADGPKDANGQGTFVPYQGSYAFNFGPYNYYQQHDELYTGGFFAHYEIAPAADAYTSLLFADDDQFSQAAPSGLFFNNGPIYAINCHNPLAGPTQLAVICGPTAPDQAGIAANGISDHLTVAYRFGGVPRTTDLKHEAYTITTGLKGDLGQGWQYDVHGQYGKTSFTDIFTGDYSNTKINDALNAIPGATPGSAVCASGNSGCVPLNIFLPLGAGLTPQQLAYIATPALKSGGTTEQVVTGSVTGDLGHYGVKSPLAHDGVGVALGAEYRRETLKLSVDSAFASGDLSGNGGVNPPANGGFDVKELFGELRVPLAQDLPLAKNLALELGYRYSHYSLSGDTNAYKISADWAPISDIRFRGGFNRAVRAPNIVELFGPQNVNLESYGDPCSNDAGKLPTATFAQCALTGVTAAQYGHIPTCGAAQCSALQGGNPLLKPEEANTYTVGAVIQPHYVPGLSLTIDYFRINITNPITKVGGGVILAQCLNGNQNFCGPNFIHRAPGSGSLFGITLNDGYVIDTEVNSGSIKTSGLDLGASYRLKLAEIGAGDHGSIDFNFLGTYTHDFTTQPFTGSASYNCAGYFGVVCGEPQSKFKSETRVTWNTPWNLALSLNWRYLSPVKLDLNSSDPTLAQRGVGFVDTVDGRIPSYSYFDLAMTYKVKDRYTLRAGINNIFDRDAPVFDANNLGIAGTSGFGNGNTFPGVYDAVGRSAFVGITADF